MGTTQKVPWHDPARPDEVAELENRLGIALAEETRRYLGETPGKGSKAAGRFHVVEGRYIFGAIPVPELLRSEDRVIYHEVDVIVTDTAFITLRKEYPGHARRFDPHILLEACPEREGESSGEMFYRLLEDVAEDYEDLLDGLQEEITELESAIGVATDDRIHKRYADLRRDLVDVRRNISPLVRALRAIEDERLDIRDQIFPSEIELLVKEVKESLQRLEEELPLIADLLSGVRDYHHSYVAQRQNDVMQRLTVIAALLLVPTLIVGIYGQNFEHIPETRWGWGYGWSWFLIAASTVLQLVIFWNLGWIGPRDRGHGKSGDLGATMTANKREAR